MKSLFYLLERRNIMWFKKKEKSIFDKDNMNTDYKIGGGWGCSICWNNPKDFDTKYKEGSVFEVYGWQPVIPQKGDTLLGEFKKSWRKFVFIEVKRAGDPRDMFFGKVKLIDAFLKEEQITQ
jgi:hypothetical protein